MIVEKNTRISAIFVKMHTVRDFNIKKNPQLQRLSVWFPREAIAQEILKSKNREVSGCISLKVSRLKWNLSRSKTIFQTPGTAHLIVRERESMHLYQFLVQARESFFKEKSWSEVKRLSLGDQNQNTSYSQNCFHQKIKEHYQMPS